MFGVTCFCSVQTRSIQFKLSDFVCTSLRKGGQFVCVQVNKQLLLFSVHSKSKW